MHMGSLSLIERCDWCKSIVLRVIAYLAGYLCHQDCQYYGRQRALGQIAQSPLGDRRIVIVFRANWLVKTILVLAVTMMTMTMMIRSRDGKRNDDACVRCFGVSAESHKRNPARECVSVCLSVHVFHVYVHMCSIIYIYMRIQFAGEQLADVCEKQKHLLRKIWYSLFFVLFLSQ